MPRIARIGTLTVLIYYNDHNPPHVHFRGPGLPCAVEISGEGIRGDVSSKQHHEFRQWVDDHRTELLELWDRACRGQPLAPIGGGRSGPWTRS
jgi:hypothetical protein